MASTTIISLFVVLLATFCYSLPVQDKLMSEYEYTTIKPLVERESMPMLPEEVTTFRSVVNDKRTSEDRSSEELTTIIPMDKDVRIPVEREELMYVTTEETRKREMEEYTTVVPVEREVEEYTTVVPVEREMEEYTTVIPSKREMEEYTTVVPVEREMEEYTTVIPDKREVDEYTTVVPVEREVEDYTTVFPSKREELMHVTTEKSRKRGMEEYTTVVPVEREMEEYTTVIPSKRGMEEYTTVVPVEREMEEYTTVVPEEREFDEYTTVFPKKRTLHGLSHTTIKPTEESSSEEVTTFRTMEKFVETPKKRQEEYETPKKRQKEYETEPELRDVVLPEEYYTTMESSTDFNRRATGFGGEDEYNKYEGQYMNKMEKPTMFETSPSRDSIVKTSKVVHHQYKTEEKPYRSEYEPSEERFTKTESIIPGKIIESKFESDIPRRPHLVEESTRIRPTELSQGKTEEYTSYKKSDY